MKVDAWRSRWAAAGAAIAISLGGGGLFAASALGNPGDASSLVPVVPVRVLDTREAASTIHTLSAGGVVTLSLAGSVPADATAASINLTVVNGTAGSFLTLFPTGSAMPLASAINWADGQAHANATVIKFGTDKSFNIFNNAGTVDVVVDLVGYFIPSAIGQQGPGVSGPKGDTGEQGPAGANGTTGAKGDTGEQGFQGDAGPQGEQGFQGDAGPQGEQGFQGDAGPQGITGADGPQGAVGAKGDTGEQGFQGDAGPQGDTGADGPQGAVGAKGDTGEQGFQGDAGPQGITGADGPQGATGATGATGAKGDTGATGATGATGPAGANGTNGTNGTNGGLSGYVVVTSAAVSTTSALPITNTATCPIGKKAIGGGYSESTGNGLHVFIDGPATVNSANDSWLIRAERIQSTNATFTVSVICVTAT